MGFRFQRRIKLFPGFYLNLSKSGVSASAGVKGFTVNSRGMTTVGIPGTGLSYRHNHNTKQQAQQPAEPQTVGYSSNVINDEILQLRHALIDCGGDVLFDLAQKCREQQGCPPTIYIQAKLLTDLESVEDWCRSGETIAKCSGRIRKICKAATAVLTYASEMNWCDTESA